VSTVVVVVVLEVEVVLEVVDVPLAFLPLATVVLVVEDVLVVDDVLVLLEVVVVAFLPFGSVVVVVVVVVVGTGTGLPGNWRRLPETAAPSMSR
jgi:hypothetical protein